MRKQKRIDIAELRHRITFQQLVETSDGIGGKTTTWSNVATVWAKIETLSARERLFSQQLEFHKTHQVTVRKASEYTPTNDMQILYNDRVFQVKGVHPDEQGRQYYYIDAEENTAT